MGHHDSRVEIALGNHRKIALVTGAGSGIGRASSLALMKAGFTAGELILEGPKLVFGIHSELISKLNNLSSSNERHLCCHDRHKHHVCIEWQICHARHSIADIIDIHTRLWHPPTIGL